MNAGGALAVGRRPLRISGQTSAAATRLIAGAVTILAGFLSIGSAITADVPWRHELLLTLEPGTAARLAHVLAAAGGVCLLGLGWGIITARRQAARAATIVLITLAVLHALKGLDYEESIVVACLAVLLHVNRRAFRRGGNYGAGLVAALVAVGAMAALYTVDTIDLLVSDRVEGLGSALRASAHALISGGWWLRSGEPVAIVLDMLLVLALLAAVLCVRALLMPAVAQHGHSCADHRRAAEIVARHGADSLDPFALREDKSFHFAHGGFLAYRTLRGTAVVSGDVIGPPKRRREIDADFVDFAASRGWDVVFTASSPSQLPELRSLGLRSICIGQEAVVRPERFSLEGRSMRKVRQSVHRLERRGWTVEVVDRLDGPGVTAAELDRVERAWRASHPRVYGFAMCLGRLWGAPEDTDAVYVLGRDPSGRLQAFIRFVRCRDGLSLDTMRRGGDEPNGLYEAMISQVLGWASERGLAAVSLNFAGFGHVMREGDGLTRGQRLLRVVLRAAHNRFQLERLARFNEKFKPEWRPRYLVYAAHTRLPIAALRVLQAEAYIRPPRCRLLDARWEPSPYPIDATLRLPQPGAFR